MEKSSEKTRFYWLDAVRFLSAFIVLLNHGRNTFFFAYGDLPIDQQGIVAQLLYFFSRLGHEAVLLFFVLSGFLVGGLGIERLRNGSLNLTEYAIDRFARIFPPLLTALLFFLFTAWMLPGHYGTDFTWGRVLGNLFCLQGICCKSLVSPFWTLSYEVWFYILFGLLGLLLGARKNGAKIVAFFLFFAAFSVFFLGLKLHYLLIWMMGALAYIARPKEKSVGVLLLSILAFAVGTVCWEYSEPSRSVTQVSVFNRDLLELFIALSSCLIIQQLILCEPHNVVCRKVEQFFGQCAKFSYTLYLNHRIVFIWVVAVIGARQTFSLTLADLLKYCMILVVTIIVCWGLYFCAERRSPQLKRWLKLKLKK